jgi:hypothetical protein
MKRHELPSVAEVFGGILIVVSVIHFLIALLPANEFFLLRRFSDENAVGATANAVERLVDRDVYPAQWLIAGLLCIVVGRLGRLYEVGSMVLREVSKPEVTMMRTDPPLPPIVRPPKP